MSVTRSLFRSRMLRASAISLASSLARVLFHMPRSSIHCMPNSFAVISQERPKSCVISSLITATLNGEFIPSPRASLRDTSSRLQQNLSASWTYRARCRVRRWPSRGTSPYAAIRIPQANPPFPDQVQPSGTDVLANPLRQALARHPLCEGRAGGRHAAELLSRDHHLPGNNVLRPALALHSADRRQRAPSRVRQAAG